MEDTEKAGLLLGGIRGRRLLLEYALAGERAKMSERDEGSLGEAVHRASSLLDADKGHKSAMVGSLKDSAKRSEISPEEVAKRLECVDLLPPTAELLNRILADTAAHARYWEAPDGQDKLLMTDAVMLSLSRIADAICVSAPSQWWWTPLDANDQWAVQWDDLPPRAIRADLGDELREATNAVRMGIERRDEPDGAWWSHPGGALPTSTRSLSANGPAGLWFVEDDLGWSCATSVDLIVPRGANIFEIEGAASWAELCRQFPLDVTVQKEAHWRQASGVSGRWVLPDWAAVAECYDGVHLQVGAYLTAAGTSIPVVETGAESTIAGWNPDETYWFTPRIAYGDAKQSWTLVDANGSIGWLRS